MIERITSDSRLPSAIEPEIAIRQIVSMRVRTVIATVFDEHCSNSKGGNSTYSDCFSLGKLSLFGCLRLARHF